MLFQDNYNLIKDNIWIFLLFTIIITFLTLYICKKVYYYKYAELKNRIKQIKDENDDLRAKNKALLTNVEELSLQLYKCGICKALEEKNNKNSSFTSQIIKEFSVEN